jgi:hypothetical protein
MTGDPRDPKARTTNAGKPPAPPTKIGQAPLRPSAPLPPVAPRASAPNTRAKPTQGAEPKAAPKLAAKTQRSTAQHARAVTAPTMQGEALAGGRNAATLLHGTWTAPGEEPDPRLQSGLKPSRAIGGSLTALVRQSVLYRKGVEKGAKVAPGGMSDTQRGLAERTAKLWRRATPNALELEPTRVLCGGEVALEADAEHNQWVLFAFMGGVRRIEPKPAMTASDVLRLVQELVLLEATTKSISHFRDWLDADGAEGFDVRVHTSFREVIEEIDIEEEREFGKAFAMARFEAPRSGDAVYIASRDLDMVAMRKEFEVPIEMYAEAANAVGGLSDDDLKEIGGRCDDANAWATAEIEAVLAVPELRTAITPEHMARRVVTRLASEADQRFLMLLTKLNSKKDPFRQAVANALGTQEVGEIIARQLQLHDDAQIEALGQFLVLSPPGVSQAVLGGFLDRASDESAARSALVSLVEWYGAAQFCEWVPPAVLNEETAGLLGNALAQVRSAPAELSRLLGAATVESALAILNALPQQMLTELGRPVRVLYGRAKGEQIEPIIELLIKTRAPDNLKFLGDMLLEGKADKWRGRTLYALCAGLVEAGMGRSHVLAIAQKRDAVEQTRLIALDCIQKDPSLVREVTRFRLTGMFDSSAVRTRLREISKKVDP